MFKLDSYIAKVVKTKSQTRITIPRMLAEESGLRDVDVVRLVKLTKGAIRIEAYHGKKDSKDHS